MSNIAGLPNRLLSLDVFRGLTLALMVLVNTPGNGEHVYPPLQHAKWHGWTPTDCVFPSFVWIIGVAVTLVIPRRLAQGQSKSQVLAQAAKRTAILFAWGLLLYAFPSFPLDSFRILGVLQRLALCYFATVLAVLYLGPRVQALLAFGLLAAYCAAMKLIPAPGFLAGDLSVEGNLAHYIDRLVLGAHNYANTKTWDPEGVLSTIPAIASCLLGALAALRLQPVVLALSGVALATSGLVLDAWFPINKSLWTPTFVLLMAGLDSLILGALIWIVDQRGWIAGFRPFQWLGANAIVIYLVSEFLVISLDAAGWRQLLYERLFATWASPINASLAFALVYTGLHVALAWWLWRRRIFVRV
jgi:predicted acyltransferase